VGLVVPFRLVVVAGLALVVIAMKVSLVRTPVAMLRRRILVCLLRMRGVHRVVLGIVGVGHLESPL
jgi:hypothetical protein